MNGPILVTGGAGFLGSWLVRALLDQGESVRVLDLPRGVWSRLLLSHITRVPGDIRDRAAVAGAVRGCRAVCHLAGLPQLWVKPRGRFSQVNYRGSVNVLDEAVRAGCERIVHGSSATIWPPAGARIAPWSEVVGPYSRSKWRAEEHALRLAAAGAPIVVVSPTLPIGPGDWSRTPPTQLLLDVCRRQRREYLDAQLNLIDVRDAASAIVAALRVGVPGDRYLLGNTNVTLLDLFRRLAALTGQPAPWRRIPYPVALAASVCTEWWADVVSGQDPAACIAGVQLTRRPVVASPAADVQRLGVTPRPLEVSLTETIAWFREAGWLNTHNAPEVSASGVS
jgi:dihydroflavonol-4-reductase